MIAANGNEGAPSGNFASELHWDDLLARLDEGTVIPVIGERVVTANPNDELLHPQLARLIARRLEERATSAEDVTNPGQFITTLTAIRSQWEASDPLVPSLNDVATAWLQAGGNRFLIYQDIKDTIVTQRFSPGETLRQLARIGAFKLFITTTFDPLLEEAIASERGGDNTSSVSTWVFEKDMERDLSTRKNELQFPTVCYMLGRYSSIEFVVSEEDALEFVCNLGRSLEKATRLALDLKDNGLLMIGLNFPDWLVRFFLRIAKQSRLSDQKRIAQYLAERPPIDPSMTLFFQGTRVRIFKGEPTQFVGELARRWEVKCQQSTKARILPKPCMAPGEPEPRIFISYAREDYIAAERLRSRLMNDGVVCWLDVERLNGGDNWPHELRIQVSEKCWAFISLISEKTESVLEGWFIAERKMAIERKMHITDREKFYFPVVIDQIEWPFRNEPDGTEELQWTYAPNGVPSDTLVTGLKEVVKRRNKQLGRA